MLHQQLPCGALALNDLIGCVGEQLEDFVLRAAECDLVGKLVELAAGLASLAVKPAHGQTQLAHRADDLPGLVQHGQRGEMQHDAGAHPCAGVGGAGGQISPAAVEGKALAAFQRAVDSICLRYGFVQL